MPKIGGVGWRELGMVVLVLLLSSFLFTFKFLQVPPGIETDEGAIGHNAALIAKTLRDQNGRFLPAFILSSDKVDWKQPVLIYMSAVAFKLFGTSLATFKMVNVVLSLVTMVVMWILLRELFDSKSAIVGLLVYVTTPIVLIASRLANEGIHPVLFASSWLLSLLLYAKGQKVRYLVLAALSLGTGFYSYKGMRLIVPPWIILSGLFIVWQNLINTKRTLKHTISHLLIFGLCLMPFFATIPLLEQKYPGSVFDRNKMIVESYRHFSYYWLSNLGLGFLFVQGDVGKIFSVELFGSFLLAALPLFLLGFKKAIDSRSFITFVLLSYILAPILFGLAGSMGYGHRLIALVPAYVVLTTLGFHTLWQQRNKYIKLVGGTLLLGFYLVNSFGFMHYYFFKYPGLHSTREGFGNADNKAFMELSTQAERLQAQSYIEKDIYLRHGEGNQFFEVAYFNQPLKMWTPGEKLPQGSVLLTAIESVEGMSNTSSDIRPLFILKSNN